MSVSPIPHQPAGLVTDPTVINRLVDEVNRLVRLSVSPPLRVRQDAAGTHLDCDVVDEFWARLTAEGPNNTSTGGTDYRGYYSWQEYVADAGGLMAAKPNGRTGTYDNTPAIGVPRTSGLTGSCVRLVRGAFNASATPDQWEYRFDLSAYTRGSLGRIIARTGFRTYTFAALAIDPDTGAISAPSPTAVSGTCYEITNRDGTGGSDVPAGTNVILHYVDTGQSTSLATAKVGALAFWRQEAQGGYEGLVNSSAQVLGQGTKTVDALALAGTSGTASDTDGVLTCNGSAVSLAARNGDPYNLNMAGELVATTLVQSQVVWSVNPFKSGLGNEGDSGTFQDLAGRTITVENGIIISGL